PPLKAMVFTLLAAKLRVWPSRVAISRLPTWRTLAWSLPWVPFRMSWCADTVRSGPALGRSRDSNLSSVGRQARLTRTPARVAPNRFLKDWSMVFSADDAPQLPRSPWFTVVVALSLPVTPHRRAPGTRG